MKKGLYYLLTLPFCVLLTVLRTFQLAQEIDERGLFHSNYVFSVSLSLVTVLFAAGLFVLFWRTRERPPQSLYKSDFWAQIGCAALAVAFFLRTAFHLYTLASGDMSFTALLKTGLALMSVVGAGVFYLVASGEKLSKGMLIVSLAPVYSYTVELILEFVPMTENAQIFGYIFKILAILSAICAFYLIVKRFYNRNSGRVCALMCVFASVMLCVDLFAPYLSYKSFSFDVWHVMLFAQNLLTLVFFLLSGPFFSCAVPGVKGDAEEKETNRQTGEQLDSPEQEHTREQQAGENWQALHETEETDQ